jgi:septal ring factor EnvC (AmiA/AmiB activator)
MNYSVKIKIPNKMFIIHNKLVRSPFECIISENFISLIKSRIKFYGLQNKDYTIKSLDQTTEDHNQEKVYDYIPESKEQKKERKSLKMVPNKQSTLESKNKSININNIKPIQKNIKKEQKAVHQQQEPYRLPISSKKEKSNIYHDPSKKIEQNINNNLVYNKELENNKNSKFVDTEVKIEELTINSSSILEKFLNSEF